MTHSDPDASPIGCPRPRRPTSTTCSVYCGPATSSHCPTSAPAVLSVVVSAAADRACPASSMPTPTVHHHRPRRLRRRHLVVGTLALPCRSLPTARSTSARSPALLRTIRARAVAGKGTARSLVGVTTVRPARRRAPPARSDRTCRARDHRYRHPRSRPVGIDRQAVRRCARAPAVVELRRGLVAHPQGPPARAHLPRVRCAHRQGPFAWPVRRPRPGHARRPRVVLHLRAPQPHTTKSAVVPLLATARCAIAPSS